MDTKEDRRICIQFFGEYFQSVFPEGQVLRGFKSAVVTLLLKKDDLDPDDLNNLCPNSTVT